MAGVAADMRAGQRELLAQEMDQQHARLGQPLDRLPLTVIWMCIFAICRLPQPRAGARARSRAGPSRPRPCRGTPPARARPPPGSVIASARGDRRVDRRLVERAADQRLRRRLGEQRRVGDVGQRDRGARRSCPPATVSITAAAAVA